MDSNHHDIESFFGLITGTTHLENRISRVFQACFIHSLVFRRAVLIKLGELTGIGSCSKYEFDGWNCRYQPPTPSGKRDRPDLLIFRESASDPRRDRSSIYIESKIRSSLTEGQLGRYKKQGVKNLIALTKNFPELPNQIFENLHVHTVRWQDIHASLNGLTIKTQKDRFICQNFCSFLEEADMAYDPRELTVEGMEKIHRMFRRISRTKPNRAISKPDDSFECASRCISLSNEIYLDLTANITRLKKARKWVGYWKETDKQRNINFHALSCVLSKRPFSKNNFHWSFCFPQKHHSPIVLYIYYVKNGKDIGDEKIPLREFVKRNKINTDILTKTVIKYARRWNVRL